MPNTKQQPLQCTTELHSFVGCQFDNVSVDAIKGQIHDETGAAVALGDTAKGGHASKAAEMFETRERVTTTKFRKETRRREAGWGSFSRSGERQVAWTTCGGYVGGPIGRGTQVLQGRVHELT
jgi:hypothetical protein